MMNSRVSTDAISVLKYADMMARCSKQPWAIYTQAGNVLIAQPYKGAQHRLIEVCHP